MKMGVRRATIAPSEFPKRQKSQPRLGLRSPKDSGNIISHSHSSSKNESEDRPPPEKGLKIRARTIVQPYPLRPVFIPSSNTTLKVEPNSNVNRQNISLNEVQFSPKTRTKVDRSKFFSDLATPEPVTANYRRTTISSTMRRNVDRTQSPKSTKGKVAKLVADLETSKSTTMDDEQKSKIPTQRKLFSRNGEICDKTTKRVTRQEHQKKLVNGDECVIGRNSATRRSIPSQKQSIRKQFNTDKVAEKVTRTQSYSICQSQSIRGESNSARARLGNTQRRQHTKSETVISPQSMSSDGGQPRKTKAEDSFFMIDDEITDQPDLIFDDELSDSVLEDKELFSDQRHSSGKTD